jgi:hypothetical protein
MIKWPVEVTESKYSRWYEALITKAQNRSIEGYVETHHIIPRSFGGDDSKANLVKLTAREHYVAHALLWKMKFAGVYGSKMAFAFNTFINKMVTEVRGVHHTYTISSRMYETFRKEYSRLLKEKYAREGGTWVGRKHTEETKRKIGEKSKLKEFKRGPDHPNYGKPSFVTPEGKARQLEAIKNRWADPEFKTMMTERRKAYFETPAGIAQRKAHSKRVKGVPRDPAVIEKTASKKRGKKAHEIFSPQALANMAEGRKHRVYTPEGKAKQIENTRRIGQRPKSEEHKRKISESNKGKHNHSGINNPNYGKKMPEAQRQAMIDRMTGRKYSPEEAESRKQARLAHSKTCEYCGKFITSSNYTRWHGNNCKLKIDQK